LFFTHFKQFKLIFVFWFEGKDINIFLISKPTSQNKSVLLNGEKVEEERGEVGRVG